MNFSLQLHPQYLFHCSRITEWMNNLIPTAYATFVRLNNGPLRKSPHSDPWNLWILPCCCSVAKLCLTHCDTMDCSTPGFSVLHYLLEFAQIHVHWVSVTIQPSHHPLLSPSPPALNLSQHVGLFQWVSSSHLVATILELQLPHQSFQWIFRVDFL